VRGQGYTLKAGRSIYANIILTQRDPNHFTDPETFDPERFSLDRAEDQKAKFAWVLLIWPQTSSPTIASLALTLAGRWWCTQVVFGGGGHSCLGMKLALLELKMMTSYLVRDYDWQAVPGQDMRIEWAALSPSPKDLYKVRFWPKKQPAA
jgi:cytochrome P450